MTRAEPATLPHVVLEPADLDVLELVVGGALVDGVSLSAPENPAARDGDVALTDGEGTPLAIFHPYALAAGATTTALPGTITQLRARALRVGAAWDPTARRAAHDVRTQVADDTDARPVLAVAFSEVPTDDDLARAEDAIESSDPRSVLWVALVSSARTRRASAHPDAVAAAVAEHAPGGAISLVVPGGWREARTLKPLQTAAITATLDTAEVLAAYGATRVVDVVATRGSGASDSAAHPDRPSGAVVLFTGLSGSGKSTVAHELADRLQRAIPQPIVVLDGDEVRRMLSSELGFDQRGREVNLQRVGYVASLLAEVGGVAIAAPIAPFEASREEIRRRVEKHARFILVHVSTPLAVCEKRDRKGLYARARSGELADFTGISSPYEEPTDADVTVDTSRQSVEEAATAVLDVLLDRIGPKD
jgi:sulfate adenylyltransferase